MKMNRMKTIAIAFAAALSLSALLFAADFQTSFKSASQEGVYTSWNSTWQFAQPGTGTFYFTAKATNDIHIAISDSAVTKEPMYEIVIGGWGNATSAIRRQSQGELMKSASKGIRKVDADGTYWVSINALKKTVSFGYGNAAGKDVIIEWKDPAFLAKSSFFALSSWDTPIEYKNISLAPEKK